jgi:small-conductance mechanosensitive channel/CRP-like cAMP-binding protein
VLDPSRVMNEHLLQAVIGLGLFVLTLALRAWSVNRLVRRKLRLSLFLSLVYALINLALSQGLLADKIAASVQSVASLFLALSVTNLVVVVLINPLRVDRIPERFPNIVQDTIVTGLFLLIATFVLQEKLLTTSAVGAVVVGFALQDTLGNTFAGLAIQIEKPFRVGHWVAVGSYEGMVYEVTWRATKLKTKSGNLVVLPNAFISKEAITNFSEPEAPTRLEVLVGATYDATPGRVKAVVMTALDGLPLLLKKPGPEIHLVDFGNSALTYRVRFWINDYAIDSAALDSVRAAIYYGLRRERIEIPYPIHVEYRRRDKPERDPARDTAYARMLERVDLFAPLGEQERLQLVAASRHLSFGAGQAVVRQEERGNSMFVIVEGSVRVAEASGRDLAVITAPGYVGEMSLLTGQPRSASVFAATESTILELTADSLRAVALAAPDVLERISTIVATRRADLERQKAEVAALPPPPPESPKSLLTRIRAFLALD